MFDVGVVKLYDICVHLSVVRPSIDVKLLPPTVFHAEPLVMLKLKRVAAPNLTPNFDNQRLARIPSSRYTEMHI